MYHMICQTTFAYKNRDWWTNDRSMSYKKTNYDTGILLSYDSYHKLYQLRRLYMERYMVTLNTDSLSRMGRFGNGFRLTYSRKPMHFFISYTLIYALTEHTIPLKPWTIAHFTIFANSRTVFSDLGLWSHFNSICDITLTRGTDIVTSYLSIVLAPSNRGKDDIYLWITNVNIDFSSHGIHGITC